MYTQALARFEHLGRAALRTVEDRGHGPPPFVLNRVPVVGGPRE
ncbi:MAG TPA: hypothetical protein VM536_13085 [Chloroflexia bacterium]|nr:hypothetical protein [Chloroflexia bacterium]